MANTRAEEIRSERRRKPGDTNHLRQRLTIDENLKDPRFEYRFANDEPGRVEYLQSQDYDLVHDRSGKLKSDATGEGTPVSVIVGTNADGSPKRAFLMRKRKDWLEADKKEKSARIRDRVKSMNVGAGSAPEERSLQGKTYVPGGATNSIKDAVE